MNSKLRRRMIVVTGIIVIAIVAVVAVVQAATGSRTLSIAEAASGEYNGQRVQVTGQVVDNSFQLDGSSLSFMIYDAADPEARLPVLYDGAMSATFGNQVTAICTGVMSADGVLLCSTLVTKCPSKYENATDALSVSQLLAYGDSIVDVTVKVSGSVQPGSIQGPDAETRLVLTDEGGGQLAICFSGGLPGEIGDGTQLVVTGSLDSGGRFVATDISIRE
ncbi:MAG: cytochrome c maturation protein CcmE [Coriobacteriia bacterium]|nr:cytochrome c maturation protein CcmE [Coriobacteriia bacterium]